MPKKTKVKYAKPLSRAEELAVLNTQIEEAKKNPKLARKTAQKAGILDKNGKLTAYYRGSAEETEMPKKKEAKYVKPLSRHEELAILQAQTEEIKKNPEIGLKILRNAGIVDKNGKLTKYYRQTS